jgi:hypothetical protein
MEEEQTERKDWESERTIRHGHKRSPSCSECCLIGTGLPGRYSSETNPRLGYVMLGCSVLRHAEHDGQRAVQSERPDLEFHSRPASVI